MLSGRFGSIPDVRNLRDFEYTRRFQDNTSFSKGPERMVALILLKAYHLDQTIKTHSCNSFVSVSASYSGVRYLVINRVYLSKVTESWTQMEGSVQGIKVEESWEPESDYGYALSPNAITSKNASVFKCLRWYKT